MIVKKIKTCCFELTSTHTMKLKNKQKTLSESVCENCWQSLVTDIFQRDTFLMEKLEKYLKYIFKFIAADVIDVMIIDAIHRVRTTLHTFACVTLELVNGYKMPVGLLSYAKMIARNMVINYLNAPKAKMIKKIVSYKSSKENETDFETWASKIKDVDQPLADEIVEREEKNKLIKNTIQQVKNEVTNRNKELKQKIIDLHVFDELKNREIFAVLTKEERIEMKDDALYNLIVNTAYQFRQSFKEKISLALEI